MPKTIVAEKEIHGRYCGQYRIYDKENPLKTLRYIQDLSDFLDSCVLAPINCIRWDECEVKTLTESYTIQFDDGFRRELARDIIGKLVAINTGTDMYQGEETVYDCVETCKQFPDDASREDIIMDYLGLGYKYLWIFE